MSELSKDFYWPDANAANRICDLLNDRSAGKEVISDGDWRELHSLAEHWIEAGGDYSQFVLAWLRSGHRADFANGTFNIQSYGSEPSFFLYPSPDAKHPHAIGLFLQFLQRADSGNLARCERKKCQRYFMPTSAHEKRFCMPACQNRNSSTIAMAKVRADKQRERLGEVNEAVKTFERNAPNAEWRRYVSSETGVTLRTINSWLKRGLIQAPVTKKSRR